MSPVPQPPATKSLLLEDDDILESLQKTPNNLDGAIAGGGGISQTYSSPSVPKSADSTFVDLEAVRRLSISTISSSRTSRGASPFLTSADGPSAWRGASRHFWEENQSLFLVTISQLFGALMNVTTRLLELEGEGLDPFQVLFARMLLTTVFCCSYMWWKKTPNFPLGARGIRWLLVARGLSGFFGIYGMFYSLQYLPVADAVVLTFLAPSVASCCCYVFLREPFPRSARYASLVSLIGVVLIARPTSFFSFKSPSVPNDIVSSNSTDSGDSTTFPTPTSAQRLSAVGVAMLGVMGSAGAFTSIRWIGNRAHPLISVNYFAVWCTIVSTLALSLSQPLHLSVTLKFALPGSTRQWGMLIFLGICGFVMQFLLTKGLAAGGKGNSKSVQMIYTNMLFALALDKLVFGQSPGWWSLAGSGLILGSAVFVAVQKQQSSVTSADGVEDDEETNGGSIQYGEADRGQELRYIRP